MIDVRLLSSNKVCCDLSEVFRKDDSGRVLFPIQSYSLELNQFASIQPLASSNRLFNQMNYAISIKLANLIDKIKSL